MRLPALLLMLTSLPALAVDLRNNLIDLPPKSKLVVTLPLEIKADLAFTLLGHNENNNCYLGTAPERPVSGQAPRFQASSNDRKFKIGSKFTVRKVSGFRSGKTYQGYTLTLGNTKNDGVMVLYLEQTGPAVGFTSIQSMLRECGNKLTVEDPAPGQ